MPSCRARGAARSPDPDVRETVEAVMRGSKVISAAIAHSLSVADAKVTLPQLRVLVMVHDSGPLNMSSVAEGLGVNASNASRTCDRLVRAGLLDRREAPDDRRNVALTLTPSGSRLVRSMLSQRETLFSRVVDRMGSASRVDLARGLAAFTDAARDLSTDAVGLSDGDGSLLKWLS